LKVANDAGIFFRDKLESLLGWEETYVYKTKTLFRLFTLLWEELTNDEQVNFSSLFTRMVFASRQYKVRGKTMYFSHRFRKSIESGQFTDESAEGIFHLGALSMRELLLDVFSLAPQSTFLRELELPEEFKEQNYTVANFHKVIRVVIISIDIDEFIVEFVSDEQAHLPRKAYFNIESRNQAFNSTISNITRFFKLPMVANLIDVEIDEEEKHYPAAIVLQPDFLIDATAVAKLYNKHSVFSLGYLISKFIPVHANQAILMGNIANDLLDHLIYEPDLNFETSLKKIFSINPLQIAQFSDGEVRDVLKDARMHFDNIKQVIHQEMIDQNIEKENAYVEPTFLSNTYGFQGRLDLLHTTDNNREIDIIELKSGKPFMPNADGISEQHYRQLMIYDMMISSTISKRIKPKNFILYSKLKENRLRYAGYNRTHQYEIMKLRNSCLFLEQMILNVQEEKLFERFNPAGIDDQFRFEKRDAQKLFVAYKQLDELEKNYVKSYVAFITREYHLSKTGEHGIDRSNGMAGLWLDPIDEKIEQFRMWNLLKIKDNRAKDNDPTILLEFSDRSNRLARFRVGDIVVLYPNEENGNQACDYQLTKANIIALDETSITLRLRSQQLNDSIFGKYAYWNVEGDFLDGGLTRMYKNLFYFMLAPKDQRDLLLCRRPPSAAAPRKHHNFEGVTPKQHSLLNEIIQSKDYYLLWGPPGTGKTTIMLKKLVEHYTIVENKKVLLLSYTNRAVDEICQAVESISDALTQNYLRIGSRYSTREEFREKILSAKLDNISSRKALLDLLTGTQVYCSTVSSLLGKMELLNIVEFDVVIVDEASQLLEPMLLGLLSSFKKFILIGDHKQLPAVVTQSKYFSKEETPELNEIGLVDRRNSLFERMYLQAMENEWTWAYGILDQQGRMHEDIMGFSATNFYEGKLKLLPGVERLTAPLEIKGADQPYEFLHEERLIFINTLADDSLTQKINPHEAKLAVDLVHQIKKIYTANKLEFSADSLGIITPFRAQISQITQRFKEELSYDKDLTIDTVERFQGGAKDRIIISLVTNDRNVLNIISSRNESGIDRKLNVAITRAKEQLIIIGNAKILSNDPVYASLIEACYFVNFEDEA